VRRSCAVSGWILLVLLLGGPSLTAGPAFWPAVRFSSGGTVPIAPGVSYSHFNVRTSAGPLNVHHLRLDLGHPAVRLSMGLARNQLISEDERVSSMVRRSGAVAGVNGDFFDIGDSGMPLNIAVQDGRLLRSPSGRVALAVGKDSRARIVRYRWAGSVLFPTSGATYWLAGFNTGLVPDGIVAVSNARGYGAPMPDPSTRQAVIELAAAPEADEPGQGLKYTVKGVWPQQAYYAPFPNDVLLLVGRGNAADWLLRNVTAEMPVQVNLATIPDWHEARTVIGGGPVLVENGRVVKDPLSPAPHEWDRRNPVSAVGISGDGRTMLITAIDGRQPRLSIGLTQPQLAAYMKWLGADQAMAFDSGGSVTMVVRFPWRPAPSIVNSPSDGHERPVGNALLVLSTPEVAVDGSLFAAPPDSMPRYPR
jgi:hypothetical protein